MGSGVTGVLTEQLVRDGVEGVGDRQRMLAPPFSREQSESVARREAQPVAEQVVRRVVDAVLVQQCSKPWQDVAELQRDLYPLTSSTRGQTGVVCQPA